jgi:hypothetical protein
MTMPNKFSFSHDAGFLTLSSRTFDHLRIYNFERRLLASPLRLDNDRRKAVT